MNTKADGQEEHRLPSQAVCYAYSVTMLFAQQFELNLRALLYVADYHEWGAEMTLDDDQTKRFKTIENFIDDATCGALLTKLEQNQKLASKHKDAWETLKRSCKHRNLLAHGFLTKWDFDSLTPAGEASLLLEINNMTIDIYQAVLITRSLRRQAESLADERHIKMIEVAKALEMPDYQNPNRHYTKRERKKH